MSTPVFLVERAGLPAGGSVLLDGPEGRHAAAVRRIRVGERVDLTDGAGLLAECRVAVVDKDALRLDVLARHQEPPPRPRLVVVQALPKGDRGELAVEGMTEVGVDVIVPWAASRCVTQWRAERGARSLARWRSAAREATKQSRRVWMPEVTEPASTTDVAGLLAAAALPVVLHEEATLRLAGVTVPSARDLPDGDLPDGDLPDGDLPDGDVSDGDVSDGDVVVVVGPEGGISPEELRRFEQAGCAAYRLGPTVLRTSTAGLVASAVLLARAGCWG